MPLYRLRLRPLSPWCTPWQADTLFGLLCWACARSHGAAAVQSRLIEPALAGTPPFVLSDACPGDLLPAPVTLKAECQNWSAADRKRVRKSRWITPEGFLKVQSGNMPPAESLSGRTGIREQFELHNMLSRTSSTTADGRLYPLSGYVLQDCETLCVYFRATEDNAGFFVELMRELSTFGFGAEVSSGKGEFEIQGELESADWLDQVGQPGVMTILSTFQPDADDPTEGYWETFLKYGKLGPDFGVDNVFKRPLIMLRPGAVFFDRQPRTHVGRAIPMSDLFAPDTVSELKARQCEVIHAAFGLAVPACAAQ
jgi:CRISPR-associated protein Csm4